jgi:hypothetical protein
VATRCPIDRLDTSLLENEYGPYTVSLIARDATNVALDREHHIMLGGMLALDEDGLATLQAFAALRGVGQHGPDFDYYGFALETGTFTGEKLNTEEGAMFTKLNLEALGMNPVEEALVEYHVTGEMALPMAGVLEGDEFKAVHVFLPYPERDWHGCRVVETDAGLYCTDGYTTDEGTEPDLSGEPAPFCTAELAECRRDGANVCAFHTSDFVMLCESLTTGETEGGETEGDETEGDEG